MWKLVILTCFLISPAFCDIELTYWEAPNKAGRLGEQYAASYVVSGDKWFTQVAIWIDPGWPWNLYSVDGSISATDADHRPSLPIFGYFSGSIDPGLTTDWQFINISPPIHVIDANFAIRINANFQQKPIMYDDSPPTEIWHNWYGNMGWTHETAGDWAIKSNYYLEPGPSDIEPVSIGNIKATYH
jgi:hypothetical protein